MAGKRAGLAGGRSGLFYAAVGIAQSLRPRGLRWVLMEQVPGLFSSNGGGDFRAVLHALRELGVSVGWRVLDSQWFGVPQRRRRVFVVVDLGGKRAGEVLALSQGLRGDSPPSREAREGVAASLTAGSHGSGSNAPGRRREDDVNLVPAIAGTLGAKPNGWADDFERCGAFIPSLAGTLTCASEGGNDKRPDRLVACPLTTRPYADNEAQEGKLIPVGFSNRGNQVDAFETLRADCNGALPMVGAGMSVRRLTPRECERLQSWPDDHTRYGRKSDGSIYEMADGPRYRMCGNGVTSNVAEWIGRNLIAIEGDIK